MNGVIVRHTFHLEERHLSMVFDILHAKLPNRAVWVFGSRATGRHLKQFSDLDLAVEGRLSLGDLGALREAFDESLLPIKVDVVALDELSEDFARRIRPDLVPFVIG